MTRPTFSAGLIATLRDRVIAHNESSPDKVTLNQLKKLYERHHKGEKPAERALRKVDEHLDSLAKAFDPSKHPRRADGKFGAEDEQSAAGAAADHVKRAAGAAADAAAAAAETVKRGAHHAAFYAGIADEPRKPGVKAPKKAPLNLPADRDEHRALQDENAGYSAFTSDVIPERRGEIIGSIARTGISTAGGVLIAHMLTSKKPNTVTRRVIVNGAAYPVGMAAKIAAGVPLHSLAAGMKLAEDTLGVKLKSRKVKDFAHDVADTANEKAKAGARRAFDGMITPMRWSAARLLDVAEGRSRTPPKLSDVIGPGEKIGRRNAFKVAKVGMQIVKQEGRAIGGRAGAAAFLAAVPAVLIDRAIAASPVDPVKIGALYDQTSYRVVQKALAMPELEELQKAMTGELRKAAILEGFESGLEGKLMSRLQGAGASAVASAAGSVLGAASGASVQAVRNALNKPAGDPYHDAHGRFTSKENAANGSGIGQAALAGAVAGGALAGGAHHLRLGALNRQLFHAAMDRLDAHIAGLTDLARVPAGASGVPEIKNAHVDMSDALDQLARGKADFLKNHVEADAGVKAAKASVDTYGTNSPLYYNERARQDLNSKLVSMLVPNDHFMVKAPGTGTFEPMPKIRGKVADPIKYARDAIDSMTLEEFGQATAKLLPKEKEAALKYFAMRDEIPAKIDQALKDHVAAINDAEKDLANHRAARTALNEDLRNAKADVDIHAEEGPEKEAALKAHAAVEKKITAADKKVETASKKLESLKNSGPEVISPFDNKPIQPPLPSDLRAIIHTAKSDATKSAEIAHEKLVDKTKKLHMGKIQKARDAYLADLKSRHARQIGAFVALGRKSSGLSRITGKPANDLFKAHSDHAAAFDKANAAEKKLSEQRGFLNDLEAKKAALPRGKGSSLNEEIGKAKVEVSAAEKAADDAQGELSKAQTELVKKADKFSHTYAKVRAELARSRGPAFLPSEVVRELASGAARAAKAGYDPISRYAVQPTAAHLKSVMAYVSPRVRAAGARTGQQTTAALRHAFGRVRTQPDGSKLWELDPWRTGASLTALGAAAEVANKFSDYVQARLAGDHKAKPPGNVQVDIRRHPTKPDEGHFIVHATDPRAKGDRVVLFGQRYEEGREDPININTGARLADVLNHFQNRQQDNRQGGDRGNRPNVAAQDAGWLSDKAKGEINAALAKVAADKKIPITGGGVSIPARHASENDGNNAAASFMQEYRQKYAKPDTHANGGALYGALGSLFQKQSEILKPGQFFQMLTGYKGQEKKGDGVLKANEDFGSGDKDEVQGALEGEISRIMEKSPPRDDAQKDSLRRVVAVIGKARDIPAEKLQPIYDQINGAASGGTVFSESAKEPSIPVQHRTAPVSTAPREIPDHFELGHEAPRNDSEATVDQADEVARQMGPALGIKTDSQRLMLSNAVAMYAAAVQRDANVDVPTSLKIVKDAMVRMGSGDRAAQSAFHKALQNFDTEAFEAAIKVAVRRHRYEQRAAQNVEKADFVVRGTDLDDLGALAKRMPAAFGSGAANQAASTPQAKPPTYKPIEDSAAAAADLAGLGLANHVLNHALPKVAPWTKTPEIGPGQIVRAVANPVQSVKAAASAVGGAASGGALKAVGGGLRTVGLLVGKGVIAGGLGGALYNGVQAATGGDSYRRNTTAGQNFALGLGNWGGATAGEIAGKAIADRAAGGEVGAAIGTAIEPGLGTAAGEILGGAAGGALGEFLTHAAISKHFAGYEPKAVQRVLGTRLTAPAPGQEIRAQAGEVGGGVVGNAIGGAPGEGLGGAIGSSLAILSDKVKSASQDVKSALPGRPKSPQAQIS